MSPPDASKHRRQGTLDLMRFGLHSGTKRKVDAAHGTCSAADSGSLPSGGASSLVAGVQQSTHAASSPGQYAFEGTAPHAQQRLHPDGDTASVIDLTQNIESGPSIAASRPAVLTESSRKKRRSLLLQSSSSRNVVDLT